MQIIFRDATMEDLNAIDAIRRDAIMGIRSDCFSETERRAWADKRKAEFFAPMVADGTVQMAQAADGPVAWGSSVGDEIKGVYVRAAASDAGIGRRLVARLELAITERGYRCARLAASPNAVGFYTKLGYVEHGPCEDMVSTLMLKNFASVTAFKWVIHPFDTDLKHRQIVPYNAQYNEVYAAVKAYLESHMPEVEIVHIGSTAVEDLRAKPMIDLLAVTDATDLRQKQREIEALGFHRRQVWVDRDDKPYRCCVSAPT